jgi:hypothetical protein
MGRSAIALLVPTLSACALVSGLSNIHIEDDAGVDGDALDASASPDAAMGADASLDVDFPDAPVDGKAALDLVSACGTLPGSSTFSFTNVDFSLSFWFRADVVFSTKELHPIIWKGGRFTSEPGWLIGIRGAGLTFCAGDQSYAACTPDWPIQQGHLLHIGAVADANTDTIPRVLTLYALDVTAGDKTHSAVGKTNAPNNWTTGATFTIGGASLGPNSCAVTAAGVIDDLRIYGGLLTQQLLDQSYMQAVPCNLPGGIAYFKFDEGTGAIATDCVAQAKLAISGKYGWVPTPFPAP